MRQHSRNVIIGAAVCVFILVSIGLYNAIDTRDQAIRAIIEEEKSAVFGLETKLKNLEVDIKQNDNVVVKMREKLRGQREQLKYLGDEKEKEDGVLQLPKKADQIVKEEENAEKAMEQAKEEAQARKGVLLPPENGEGNGIDMRRGGKVVAVKEFFDHVGITAKVGEDVCLARLNMSRTEGDVQMLDVYNILKFDDLDGGVWKQGWPITYDKAKAQEEKKLEVVVVPHSHTDPGWIKTYETYYQDQTKNILDSMLTYLLKFEDMRFVYAEISFFEQWWADIDEGKRENVKRLIKEGRLEILTGGWVMTDEANAHYFAMISQLIEGHEWLRNQIGNNYAPMNHWAIDPFGLSPTLAFILAQSDLGNAIVQRVHYAVKKYLAKNKQLEFEWRQLFSGAYPYSDLRTHVMPFFSYDVPHTCGPDPKICCQFDFRRLPTGDITCPWNVPPVAITETNVAERAEMLYDQYRKKAQLFKKNVVFVPLGDDFRYDISSEWEAQHSNYKQLFDYMNAKTEWNVHARFGTVAEYFDLLSERLQESKEKLPVLTGDFFTYADRNDHYWSGYFTSRPFYKHADRTAQHFLRSAEILYSLAKVKEPRHSALAKLFNLLVEARRFVGLFQHHDGVTGTAKDFVMADYGKKMLTAIKNCEQIISMAGELLLHDQSAEESLHSFFKLDEARAGPEVLPSKLTANDESEVVLFNSLAQERNEVLCIYVKSANLEIRSARNPEVEVMQQIGPVITSEGTNLVASYQKFELCFEASVPAFGFEKYELVPIKSSNNKVVIKTSSQLSASDFAVGGVTGAELKLENEFISAIFDTATGFMKSLTPKGETKTSVNLSFVSYGCRGKSPGFHGGDDLSGAYLFLPDGPAKPLDSKNTFYVIEGPVMKRIVVITGGQITLEHTATLFFNVPYVQLQNIVDITSTSNFEIAMRLKSDVESGEYFSTDLNAFQMIKRRRFSKLPLQAHFYPMPGSAFIEDSKRRLSLLGAQANGVASLESGWLEVMLDRRLMQDDGRGLFSGVTDNKRTVSTFRLLQEPLNGPEGVDKSTISFHSLPAHYFSLELYYPLVSFFANKDKTRKETYSGLSAPLPCDMHIVTLRTMAAPTVYGDQSSRSHLPQNSQALIIHRLGVDCRSKVTLRSKCSTSGGQLRPVNVLSLPPKKVTEMSLTLLHKRANKEGTNDFTLKPMDFFAFRLDFQ